MRGQVLEGDGHDLDIIHATFGTIREWLKRHVTLLAAELHTRHTPSMAISTCRCTIEVTGLAWVPLPLLVTEHRAIAVVWTPSKTASLSLGWGAGGHMYIN